MDGRRGGAEDVIAGLSDAEADGAGKDARAADALARLSSLVLQQVGNWPLVAVQHHVARAIDAVVHVARGLDGARIVVEVVEVVADVSGPVIATRQLANEAAITGALQRGRR